MANKSAAALLHEVLQSKKNARIKLVGDSITHGVGGSGFAQNGELIVSGWSQNPDGYCWANLFRDHMRQTYGATVVNKACTGTDVHFVIHHFPELVDHDDDLIICTIGTNNRHRYFDGGERPQRDAFLKEIYDKIKIMYGLFEDMGIPTIFVANIPASEKNEQDGPDYWRILHMPDINDCYQALARECGATVVSLYDLFSGYCEERGIALDALLCDGLHPNDEGYRVMYELILKALAL